MQTDELINFIESGGRCQGQEKRKKKQKKKNREKRKEQLPKVDTQE